MVGARAPLLTAPLKAISTRGFEAVVRNNLTGGFIFMREVFSRWMEANGGSIVNIIADIWHGWPEFGHSAAARGGMLTLTETAACEWSSSGVRVNAVAPGGIVSSGFDTYTPEMREKLYHFTERVPLQRFGTEAEISAAITYLLSPACINSACAKAALPTTEGKARRDDEAASASTNRPGVRPFRWPGGRGCTGPA